ncbi:MAG: hypothetical protein RL497_323 [Pseudomonadota bacterium]|jgi:chromosome segregation protein
MRLTCIHITGFKSFAEPTALNFASNRTAIVGPNGCGKSNVIDAVRWVMGESSIKHLRGDTMTDVIFNGSKNRRAQGAASVELVFDNTESRLTGQFAALATLAIKRRLSRDGDNQFFINGEKCRRRDVTDLFSGTGLGPRAYGIIEQGTIARLIDAKPDELRSFIEEAAGITLYKDRKRETAQRIERSRDNLTRINDIAQEVQKHIDKLAEQAQTAAQFRLLKQRIREAQSQQKALQWQKLQDALAECELKLQQFVQQQLELQQAQSSIQQQQEYLAAQQTHCLEAQEGASEQMVQLSQSIAQHQTHTAQQQAQYRLWQQQEGEIAQELLALARLQVESMEAAQARTRAQVEFTEKLHRAQAAQAELLTQRQQAQAQQKQLAEALARAEQDMQAVAHKQQLLDSQQQALNSQIETAAAQRAEREQAVQALEASKNTAVMMDGAAAVVDGAAATSLDAQLMAAQQAYDAQLAALQQACCQRAFIAGRLGLLAGLDPNGNFDNASWRFEAESLWQDSWPNLCKDTWAAAEPWLHPWISARIWAGSWEQASAEVQAPAFLMKPDADTQAVTHWLNSWQPVADRPAALAALQHSPQGVFFTPLGEVFAQDWLYLPAPGASRLNLQERRAELAALTASITQQTCALQKLHTHKTVLQAQHTQLWHQQMAQDYQQVSLASAQNEYTLAENHWQQLNQTMQTLTAQHLPLEQAHSELNSLITRLNAQIHAVCAPLEHWAAQEQALNTRIESLQTNIQREHACDLAAQPVAQRLTDQQQRLQLKQNELHAKIAQGQALNEPQNALQAQLEQAQTQLAALKTHYSQTEKQLKNLHSEDKSLRGRQEQLRVDWETAKLQTQALRIEQQGLLGESFDITAALAMLPAQIDGEQLSAALIADKTELEALGPVNLAALEEYEQARERARYLQQQQTDLHQALECLENAIKQIDRETRQRFKQTFDAANEGLRELFRRKCLFRINR